MKKEEETYVKNDLYKDVVSKLTEKGYTISSPENVAFMVDEDKEDVVVDINFMSTGVHYNKKDLDVSEVAKAGFKWCVTWNYISNSETND